jgi:hypothetical protein
LCLKEGDPLIPALFHHIGHKKSYVRDKKNYVPYVKNYVPYVLGAFQAKKHPISIEIGCFGGFSRWRFQVLGAPFS